MKYLNIDIVVFYHETCTGGYHWSREIDEVILQVTLYSVDTLIIYMKTSAIAFLFENECAYYRA